MKRLGIAAGLCLLIGTSAALAQGEQPAEAPAQANTATTTSGPQTQASPAAEVEEELVCRTRRVTGSLTRRQRTCMTAAEWEELSRNTSENVARAQRNGSGGRECRVDQFGGC